MVPDETSDGSNEPRRLLRNLRNAIGTGVFWSEVDALLQLDGTETFSTRSTIQTLLNSLSTLKKQPSVLSISAPEDDDSTIVLYMSYESTEMAHSVFHDLVNRAKS